MSDAGRPASDAIAAIAEARGRSLTNVVQHEIERRILAGEMRGGERFNEQSIATSLGVSRGPVREARHALESAGLVISIPGRGSFVRQVGHDEIAENYDIRALLTGFACARIAAAGDPATAAALGDLVEEMDRAARSGDNVRYFGLNLAFHDALMLAARHRRAAEIYREHVKETHLSRHLSLAQPERMHESNAEHAAIIAAIRTGDPDAARQAGEAHVRSGKARWLEVGDIGAT